MPNLSEATCTEQRSATYSKYVALCFALITFCLGVSVIIGWYEHIPWLIRYVPDTVAMVFNSALSFIILSATVIYALYQPITKIPQIIGFGVAIFAFVSLVQQIFNINLGIDELFFLHYDQLGNAFPGRMAPNTAVCFILLSLSVVLATCNRGSSYCTIVAGVLSLLSFSMALVFISGYMSLIQDTYYWGNTTPMSTNAALGFIFLSLSVIGLCLNIAAVRSIAIVKYIPISVALCLFIANCMLVAKLGAFEDQFGVPSNISTILFIAGTLVAIIIGGLLHTISIVVAANKQEQKSLSLIHATLEATAVGVVVISNNGKIADYNSNFLQMWGMNSEQIMQLDSHELIRELSKKITNKEELFISLKHLMSSDGISRIEYLKLDNGRVYEMSVRPQILHSRVIGKVWSFRDITAQKTL